VSTAAVADAAALLMLQQQEQQQEQQRRQQQRRRQQEQQQQQQQRQPDTDLAVDALLTHDEHGLQEVGADGKWEEFNDVMQDQPRQLHSRLFHRPCTLATYPLAT
jgi:hypothetical protein